MDFIYLLRVLLKRKWIILGSAIIAAAIAFYFTKDEVKYYRSTAQISTGFTVSNDININDERFSFFEADTKFNNSIVTAKSPAVLSLLSYKLILHDLSDERPFRKLSPELKKSPSYTQVNIEEAKKIFEEKLESMSMLTSYKPEEKKLLEFLAIHGYDYKSLGKNLTIYRLQRTDYLQIDYVSENPELSAFVVNNLFQQFIRYFRNVRDSKSQESIDTLRSLVEKKKMELDNKNAILRGEGLVDVKMESSSKLDMIASLENNLTAERSRLTTLYSSLRKINQRLNVPGEGNNTVVKSNNTNEELLILRKAMNDAYKDYVNAAAEEKSALFEKYNKLKAEYQNKSSKEDLGSAGKGSSGERAELIDKKNDIDIDIQATNENIASIQSRINVLKGNVESDASKGAAVETLLKDVELANNEYLAVKYKYNEAIDRTSSSVNNFRQVLVGQPAIDPESSKRMVVVGMAGIAALITCMLIIVLLTYLDPSIKTPIIFSKMVNLKLISMINFMNLKNKKLSDIVAHIDGQEGKEDHRRLNIFRESLRKLRFEIESSGKKIFLFASTKKGQGKTTLIQALSYSMSLSRKKILIIDTNFCNNDLTIQLNAEKVLESINIKGADERSIIDQVKAMSTDIGVGTVFVIGSEGGDYTPSEVLPTESLLKYLNTLTHEFDYIFLEGPPLNDFSDAKELVQYVDGVIAVFSATHIVKQIDKESIKFFKELNGKFCGSILNMVDLENVNVT